MSITGATTLSHGHRRKVASWAVKLGRFGLAARGFVYLMLGFLAVKVALGKGGKLTDREGAVREMERLPFGTLVLWFVALGLLGYMAWRFTQAFMDLDDKGKDAKGLIKRGAAIGSGLAYASLCTASFALAAGMPGLKLGKGTSGGDAMAQDWTAWLMAQPFGRWLVAIVGAVVGGVAIYQFYQAITCKFAKHLRGGGLTAVQEKWSRRAGQMGYAARGVAFGLIAWFLVKSALEADAGEAGGLAAALRALKQQPYGLWLLGAVGTGLAMFGVYSMVEARFRRFGGE